VRAGGRVSRGPGRAADDEEEEEDEEDDEEEEEEDEEDAEVPTSSPAEALARFPDLETGAGAWAGAGTGA
jgi:hypothetical protein